MPRIPKSSYKVRRYSPKVLSNKKLTTKVKALSKKEGSINRISDTMYNGVSLVAGTANIQYFTSNSLFVDNTHVKHLYYDAYIKLLTTNAAGATVRLMYCLDMDGATNATVNDVLETGTDSASALKQNINSSGSIYSAPGRNSNNIQYQRVHVSKDLLIPLIANEPKFFHVKLPLNGRVTKNDQTKFQPFMLALSDEGAVTFTMKCNYAYNVLEQ